MATSTEARAMQLLSQGLSQSVVAAAVGVTEGRISQLMENDEFRQSVTEAKFKSLTRSTAIDSDYDSIEVTLLEKLKKQAPLMYKTGELLKALQVINGAKRRGTQSPDSTQAISRTVQVVLPQVIINKFTTNIMNQVVEVTDGQGRAQSLVTTSSASLPALAALSKVREAERKQASALEHQPNSAAINGSRLTESGIDEIPFVVDRKGQQVTVADIL